MDRRSGHIASLSHAAFLVAVITSGCVAWAQKQPAAEEAKPPEYQRLRYDEDYTYLKDRSKRADVWDPLKYIPLDDSGGTYLSLGGEARLRYEYYRNFRWDPDSADTDGYLLQRYLLHADLHVGSNFRAFGQLQSSLEDWREGGPRGTDENRLDVHQLFVDGRANVGGEKDWLTLRLGRQEMSYGSQRLVSVRESPNIRRSFDAAKLMLELGELKVDAFVAAPVEDDPGIFDDQRERNTQFWGVYATRPIPGLKGVSVDLYYLGLRRPDAEFVNATGDELRHSIGSRFFGNRASWDFNFEGVVQWGELADKDIRAWTVASDTGYTFKEASFTPRVGLKADIISGDTDPDEGDLGTFNALFPRGSYFGEIALIGPANLIDVHPTLDLHVTEHVTVSADWAFFWRYSTEDGLYDNGGNVTRGADGSARFVGHQPSIGVEWEIQRHATLNLTYSHFFTGNYISESGPAADVDFVAVWFTYRF